jgi:hypothetical protein
MNAAFLPDCDVAVQRHPEIKRFAQTVLNQP